FVAGQRALNDYNRTNRALRSIAAMFSAGRDDAIQSVARLMDEHKQLTRRARTLEEVAARVEAEEIWNEARTLSVDIKLCARVLEDRDADSLKKLAFALIAHPKTIALLGSRDAETARLVFARSMDAPGDMNALMREACGMLEGKGGGRADMAQGGGRLLEKLDEAIELSIKHLTEQSSEEV
ncbi:MAG TPA: DHHA1 domain-containing protein, partial [Pyrinomonadaceae bacterium]